MLNTIIVDNLLKPALRRLGTVAATALVVGGDWLCANANACGLVTPAGATTVTTYVVAVAFVLVDLAISWLERKKVVK